MKIANKKSFRISLYSTCPIYGKLLFDNRLDASLKYFDEFGEITVDMDNYNKLIVEAIINQAEVICLIKGGTLENY